MTLAGIAITSLPMVGYLASLGILDDTARSLYAITEIYGDSPSELFPRPIPPLSQIDSVRLSPELVLPGMLVNGTDGLAASPGFQHIVAFSGWADRR